MEGCSAPLVVKFADTQREKEQKKIQQMHSTLLNNIASGNGLTSSLTSTSGGITLSAGGCTGSSTLGSGSPSNGTNSGQNAATIAAATSPLLSNPPQQANPYLATDAATAAAMTPTSLQLLQQLQAVGLQHQFMQGLIYFQKANILSFIIITYIGIERVSQ